MTRQTASASIWGCRVDKLSHIKVVIKGYLGNRQYQRAIDTAHRYSDEYPELWAWLNPQLPVNLRYDADYEVRQHIAEMLWHNGYSVIPLHGDAQPGMEKLSSIRWGQYQDERATLEEVREWFSQSSNRAIGIVTGAVSCLLVLDFDNMAHYKQFKAQYPDLCESYRVRTWRGIHIYYRLAPDQVVSSRSVPGIDLQGEGRYVVTVGSIITGHRYRVEHDAEPRAISDDELETIQQFMDAQQPVVERDSDDEIPVVPLTRHDLEIIYEHYAYKGNRNNALFHASLEARDSGWRLEDALAVLVPCHIASGTAGESDQQREREARATIQTGLQVQASLVTQDYPTGVKVSDHEMNALDLVRHTICPQWNYTIFPRRTVSYF